MQYTVLLLALAFGSSVQAHMNLQFPAPLRAAFNPNSKEPNIDYSITSPLSGAAQFPCKGYLPDLSTPGGASVQTYTPGSSYNFTIDGGAPHGGGSCQASLSMDAGKTFKVIHSYIGGCPMNSGQEFDFTVPSDTPAGPAVFAWTWFNNIGNREMYMDCASVTIAGGSKKRAAPAVAFSTRPDMFVANIGNGCTVVDNTNVLFPNPGPDVTGSSTATDTIKGTCQAVNGIGGGSSGSGSGSASGSSSPAPVGSSSPATSVATSGSSPTMSSASTSSTLLTIQTMPASSSATASATSGTAGSISTGTPSSLTLGPDGMCSGAYTCSGSPHGPCCSQWGWCGSTDAYCGDGCQAGFGQCGNFVNGTGKATTFSRGVAGRRIAI